MQISRGGATFLGFPALVDRGESVSLRMLDSPEAARRATRGGVRRLFMLQLGRQIEHLSRGLAGLEAMELHYRPLGSGRQLREQIVSVAVDRALFEEGEEIRTRAAFVERAQDGWRRLSAAASAVAELARQTLQAYHAVSLQLAREFPPPLQESAQDLREQLANLMPPDFLQATPPPWLPHLPRYLRAMAVRREKLPHGGPRDRQRMAEMRPLWRTWKQHSAAAVAAGRDDPRLAQFRWMLEELRVSLFAQELRTIVPVSLQRLERQLQKFGQE